MVTSINIDVFFNSIDRLIFLVDKDPVLCEEKPEVGQSQLLGLISVFVLDGFYNGNSFVTLEELHGKRTVGARWNLGNSSLAVGNSDQAGRSQDLPDDC
jgi:hypothetical protein